MSPLLLGLTLFLLALPIGFLAGTLLAAPYLWIPAAIMIPLYAWVWFRMRPSRFIVHRGGLEISWPLRRRTIDRKEIGSVRVMDREQLKQETGWGFRIGVGGLWGGFGWLQTERRGLIQMYISRTDRFVWIECAHGRPWLITPENPEAFVEALERAS